MTKNARDLLEIARLAGFDMDELRARLMRAPSRGERINAATVERIMGEMDAEYIETWGAEPHA